MKKVRHRVLALSLGIYALNLAPASHAESQRFGYVVTEWRHALYETPGGKEECPDGFSPSERQQHEASPDSQERLKTFGYYTSRGPNGESVTHFPWLVDDPLPSPELQSDIGYGLNLDGTNNGDATANTCPHQKFFNSDGVAVDNQMARVVGCTETWRSGGFADEFFRQEIISFAHNRILIELEGVDSLQNDPEVRVHVYKGLDGLTQGAGGSFPPYQNQRVDERFTRYMHHANGRIVDGVLQTDPVERAWLPIYWVQTPAERLIKDMRLQLRLDETSAEGFLAGYEDVNIWWKAHSRSGIAGGGASVGPFSNAWVYRAVHRYADGFPDPESGQCTAISAAYRVNAVRALIAHPEKRDLSDDQVMAAP